MFVVSVAVATAIVTADACGYGSRRKAGTTPFMRALITAASRSQSLNNRHIRHAAAFAHGLQSVALVLLLQRIHQGGHQLGAGAAQRMAERDGAAIDVEPRGVRAGGLQPCRR